MKKYLLFIEGSNAKIEIDNVVQKCGFFTTRFVEAQDPLIAEKEAINFIHKELNSIILNGSEDPPTVIVDELKETKSLKKRDIPKGGFTWYKE